MKANIGVVGPTDHEIIKSIYFFDPNGHRLELTILTGSEAMYKKLDEVKWDMLKEWGKSKKTVDHVNWLHRKEFDP